MKTTEVIVSDEGLSQVNTLLTEMASDMEVQLSAYEALVHEMCDDAISDGSTHKQWKLFANCLKSLRGQFSIIASQVRKTNEQFIRDVDSDDQYLY